MKVKSKVKAGTTKCTLASPSAAKAACSSMGQWDIAKIQGTNSQYGPGYGCKQAVEKGGIGHALCV